MLLGVAMVIAYLPGGPRAASRDRTDAAISPASLDRRQALSVFAASVSASVFPLSAQAEEPEEVYTPQAALAKLALTVEQASQLVDRLDLEQLQLLLRSPFMVSFLGYEPVQYEPVPERDSPKFVIIEQRGDPRALDQQLKLLNSFPAANIREAAEHLSGFLSEVRTLDRACLERDVNPDRLRKCAEEARQHAVDITKLYYAAGCMVCSEPVRSVIASDATWRNPGLARLDEFEPRLNRRPERTEQEEKRALAMGFRPD